MPVTVQCPSCEKTYRVPDVKVGTRVRCKQCQEPFTVATAPDATAEVASIPSTRPPPRAPEQRPAGVPGKIGRFEIKGKLGAGAFGTVYRAWDPVLEREVALKVPQSGTMETEAARQRFLREAKSAGQLRHPHIVPVYDAGSDGGQFYIASAFVTGHTLAVEMEKGQLEQRRAAEIVMKLADALQYAHEQGIVHRDVKPANIMLDVKGEPHLMDFGLAAWEESKEKLTLDGTVVGTPAYMSPEQAGEPGFTVGALSDQYSLGVVLYELLTGQRPFSGPLAALLYQIRKEDPPPPRTLAPTLPRDLETICLKAIAKSPSERFANALLLADDLRRWLEGEPIHARQINLAERIVRWARRNPFTASLTAAIAAVTLVGLVLVTWQWRLASANLAEANRQHQRAEENLAEATVQRNRAEANLEAANQAQHDRALAQVDALLHADIGQVPYIVQSLDGARAEVLPHLVQRIKEEELTDAERLRLSLALLPNDPAQIQFLRDRLLVAPPDELLVVRDALAPHADQLKTPFWTVALDPQNAGGKRFRAACVLAGFDPGAGKWNDVAKEVADTLVGENPLLAAQWLEALRPVKNHLIPPLMADFGDENRPVAERSLATSILADYAADRADVLVELVADADQKQFLALYDQLAAHKADAIDLLRQQVNATVPADATWADKRASAKRQANAAVALLRLREAEKDWSLFAHSEDPTARSYLIHRVAPLGVDPQVLIGRLDEETEVSIRRALLLCLGEFGPDKLDLNARNALLPKLLDLYRDDPGPGIHGAAEWLLRQWNHEQTLRDIDTSLAGDAPDNRRQWYVNGQGQTMVIVEGPVEFLMGSPESEPDRQIAETLHRRRIDRRFAIAAKPVTVEQYLVFLNENPAVPRVGDEYLKRYSPEADCPMMAVTWYESAAYCNWLSKKEGMAQDQWCYEANAEGKFAEGMKPVANFLSLNGYRLPTEAEWEFSCRAGTQTSRYYGQPDELLRSYAWYVENSQDRTWPVASLKPNGLGLFSMHGNVWQWCHDRKASYRTGGQNVVVDEVADASVVVDKENRVLRGGSFYIQAQYVRSAGRNSYQPTYRNDGVGFRAARTYP